MKISQLRKLIKETIEEVEIDEMARTKGTGSGITITPAGEDVLKQAKATGNVPGGIRAGHLGILKFLFLAKQDNKRVQKADYAVKMFGDPSQSEDSPINLTARKQQPKINPFFNDLIDKGYAEVDKYQSTIVPKSTKPKIDVANLLGDIDI